MIAQGRLLLIGLLLVTASGSAGAGQFSALVYTSPDQWHDQSLPTAITQFQRMAQTHFFDLTWTQDETRFTDETLAKQAVVIFLNTNARRLSAEQLGSLKGFVRRGGGFVGIHSAGVCAELDEWYQKLIGRAFTGHPEKQTGVLSVVDRHFPATMHLPEKWVWTDEWYEFGPPQTDALRVLLTVDERTYVAKRSNEKGEVVTGMGGQHPIAWYQEYDGGRSFYTALGHLEALYDDPWFLHHLYGGIYWAATGRGIVE